MKSIFLSLSILILIGQDSIAQKNYKLNINHLMNGNKFIFKQNNNNWENVNYNVTRLQYYLSYFTFVTESNQRTPKRDIVLLANANTDNYDLATLNLDSKVKEIEFYFGLDSLTNHSDPSLYPVGSPLGFQDPEMNWGWSAGYRFLAVEGVFDYDKDGSPERGFEYHMVSDRYYTKLSLPVNEFIDNSGNIILSINFNVNKLFQTLKFSQKAILHGSGSQCDIIHGNINSGLVFTPNLTNENNELSTNNYFNIKQNLASDKISIQYDFKQPSNLEIYLMNGQLIANRINLIDSGVIDIQLNSGMQYVVVAKRNGVIIGSKKCVLMN